MQNANVNSQNAMKSGTLMKMSFTLVLMAIEYLYELSLMVSGCMVYIVYVNINHLLHAGSVIILIHVMHAVIHLLQDY